MVAIKVIGGCCMKRFIGILGLSSEAILFDSKFYIVKSILAVATGYIVGIRLPIVRLDMISVLLGVMYNLEPINIIGIKGGIGQLLASTLGAVCTGMVINVFGINVFSIAAAMSLTLYVSLKINWRMVSPVAIFTCIYMTQFIQTDLKGNPSILLTFRLRIAALGLGVTIAIVYNYIFSFLYYKKIALKRLEYAKIQLLKGIEYTKHQLEECPKASGRDYIAIFSAIFNDLDMVYSNIQLMLSEAKYSYTKHKEEKLYSLLKILQYFRDINHLAYDINYTISAANGNCALKYGVYDMISDAVHTLKNMTIIEANMIKPYYDAKEVSYDNKEQSRVYKNLYDINSYINKVKKEASTI